MRIKNLVVYEEIKEDDYKSDDAYNALINEFKEKLHNMKKTIFFVSLSFTMISIVILIVLEFYQNKFKKEYFNFLKSINIKIIKKT